MKLVIAVVHDQDADACVAALTNAGFVCTRFPSFGGFLDKDNVTLMIGAGADQVDEIIAILRSHAKQRNELLRATSPVPASAGHLLPPPLEVEVGGATLFVLDVSRFEKL